MLVFILMKEKKDFYSRCSTRDLLRFYFTLKKKLYFQEILGDVMRETLINLCNNSNAKNVNIYLLFKILSIYVHCKYVRNK